MHIVHVANAYGPRSGGLRTSMHEMGRQYVSFGHEVTLVVAGPAFRDEQIDGMRRITIPAPVLPRSGGYRFIVNLRKVLKVLEAIHPDAIEVSDRVTLRCVGRWARSQGIPHFMWAHERIDGVLRAWGARGIVPTNWLADRHNRQSVASFDRIVCTTAYAEEEFDRINVPVHRIPLGVDSDLFTPDRRNEQLRAAFLQEDDFLIVMASRLSPEKRPRIAIDALAELRARGVKARLVIAGTGPIERKIHRQSWGLPVDFLGFVQDRTVLAALLASADVVFAPGPIETFGLAALEALASGTPVVASSTGALREIIVGGAGLTVAPLGVAFADAAERVLAQEEQSRRAIARQRALDFSWKSSAEQALHLHGVH